MNIRAVKLRIQELETLMVFALFFVVLALVMRRIYFVYFAMVMLVIGLFIRPLARIVTKIWLTIAEVLGSINSRIVLTLVFYFFLTPIAFVCRRFYKNPLNAQLSQKTRSHFNIREHTYARDDLERMW